MAQIGAVEDLTIIPKSQGRTDREYELVQPMLCYVRECPTALEAERNSIAREFCADLSCVWERLRLGLHGTRDR